MFPVNTTNTNNCICVALFSPNCDQSTGKKRTLMQAMQNYVILCPFDKQARLQIIVSPCTKYVAVVCSSPQIQLPHFQFSLVEEILNYIWLNCFQHLFNRCCSNYAEEYNAKSARSSSVIPSVLFPEIIPNMYMYVFVQ